MRAFIVDDETPARKRVERLLEPYISDGRLELVGTAADGIEALKQLKEQKVDVLFLDIQMPELDGFDVLDRLPPSNRPLVIFTTAYDQYALKAFEANAIDYLLKPIDETRLEGSINRVERTLSDKTLADSTQTRLADLLEFLDNRGHALQSENEPESYLTQLSVPGKDRLIILPVTDLISAEVNDGITRLYTASKRPSTPEVSRHIVSHTLDALEQRLDPAHFMRVHRSAIVQLDRIHEMITWFSGRYKLVLTGGHEVIASRARSKELKDRLSL